MFTPDPGTVYEMQCRVCSSKCLVNSEKCVSKGFASAMAGRKSHHDLLCPHADDGWHAKNVQLFREIEDMPGRRVAESMKKDLLIFWNSIKNTRLSK